MTRIYIAGPCTGLKDSNYPAFNEAAANYRALGYEVENPAENPPCDSWLAYMRLSLLQIARADALYMLPGWENSKGALIEHGLAMDLGLPVVYAQAVQGREAA